MQESKTKVVLRFSHIGDIVLLSGVLLWRYKQFNEQFILITQKNVGAIFENNPAIKHIEEYSKEDLRGKALLSNARKIAEKYPYPLYDMHNTLRSKLFRAFWKEKVYVYAKDALARRLFLLSKHKIRPERLKLHVVERYAQNFTALTPSKEELLPCIMLSKEEIDSAQSFLAKRNTQKKKIIALHPFATHKGKIWNIKHFEELYTKLSKDYFPLIIGKGEAFQGLKEEHNALNAFSLRESAALISLSSCLVTGDSAPLHIANAVQTPVIALFGATAKEWGFFPLGKKDVLLQKPLSCTPCSLHGQQENCPHNYSCINNVHVDEVYLQIENIIRDL